MPRPRRLTWPIDLLLAVGLAVLVVVVGTGALLLWIGLDARGRSTGKDPRVVPTRGLMDRVTSGSIILSRHVTGDTRRATLFNAATAGSDWYHVGVAVRRAGRLYVLDCMADGPTCELPCAGAQVFGRGGPRLIDAMHYMLLYSTNPGVCAFRVLEGTAGDTAWDNRAWTVMLEATTYEFLPTYEYLPKMCEGGLERLLGRRVGRRGRAARLGSGVFCSEVVALVLMELGILDKRLGASSFAPWSFCRQHIFDDHLLGSYQYTPPLIPHVFGDAFALRVSKS
jgi:hypothetical protein